MRDHDPASLIATDSAGNGLRVDFVWQHDRYAHSIIAIIDGDELPLWQSVEGTEQDRWPPSPPLQQLSIEELRPGHRVALLLGMAGKSHWSVSVEPISGRCAFAFDVACRLRHTDSRLGSVYRGTGGTACDAARVTLDRAGRSCSLAGCGGHQAGLVLSPDGTSVHIEPQGAPTAATVRWQYVVACDQSI